MKTLIRSAVTSLMRAIRFGMAVLRMIFGEIRWSPPPWMKPAWGAARGFAVRVSGHLEAARRRNPTTFWISSASSLILIVAGAAALRWYLNRPQPRYVEVNGAWPRATELKPDAQIEPLRLSFTASAARLGTVGKAVTSAITIEPPLDGVWQWRSDFELTFAPRKDWEVGRAYTVTFSRGLFAPQVVLKHYSYNFRSPAFAARITTAAFYEDPTDARNKQVIATVEFTHPVDKADLEKRIGLRMRIEPVKSFEGSGVRGFGFKLSYDKTGGIAYIHSEPFSIPNNDAEMQVRIGAGVHSSRRGPGTADVLMRTVSIPGIASYSAC